MKTFRIRCLRAPTGVRVAAAVQTLAVVTIVGAGLAGSPLHAQVSPPDTVVAAALRPVSISVSRDQSRSPFELPFATTTVSPDALRPAHRKLSLGDVLFGVPGVSVQERGNPTQEARLAIRGFGARSAFGVRGVRVLRDGIPLSLPDGQTPTDWLELESIGAIDIIRGTAAALYGNAAGGVVDFRSAMPASHRLAVSARYASDGYINRNTITVSGMQDTEREDHPWRVTGLGGLVTATGTEGDGMRQWSGQRATNVFARTFASVAGTRIEVQGTRYDATRAENTGALTADELARDPLLPDSLNIRKHSRKGVVHQQLALLADRGSERASIHFSTFASTRTLDNPLAFAIVAIDRAVAGASLRANAQVRNLPWPVRMTLGVDVQRQDDSRLNYENCADFTAAVPTAKCAGLGERGAVRLDQREQVNGIGAYVQAEVRAPRNVFVSVAARHDRVGFHVTDRFITASNLDDSGEQTLTATTPMVGVVWRVRPSVSVFGNWTTAFETPTITELTNQANGDAGLNALLLPQRTRTLETGVQALVGNRVRLDMAAFRATVHDELVPFDVPNAPGRRAFRNAGQSTRVGWESSVRTVFTHADIGASYTLSRFQFDEYTVGSASYAGNAIPGVPRHAAQLWSTTRWRGFFGTMEASMVSAVSANDAATVQSAGYAVWALRTGFTGAVLGNRASITPVVGVDNIFDRRFASSVVVNATRGRYFEPGLPRRVYFSVSVGAH